MRDIENVGRFPVDVATKVKDDAGLVAESMRKRYQNQRVAGRIARLAGKVWKPSPNIEVFNDGSPLHGMLRTSPFGEKLHGTYGSPSIAFVLEVPARPSDTDDFLRINDVMLGRNGGYVNCGPVAVFDLSTGSGIIEPIEAVNMSPQISYVTSILGQAAEAL